MKKNRMIILLYCFLGGYFISMPLEARNKAYYKQKKQLLTKRIQEIKQILSATSLKKNTGINQLHAMNRQLEANLLLIQSLDREIDVLQGSISAVKKEVKNIQEELYCIRKEYAKMVYTSAKKMYAIHKIIFLLSANSFYEMIRRIKYWKQYAMVRTGKVHAIKRLYTALEKKKKIIEQQKKNKEKLLTVKNTERKHLQQIQQEKKIILTTLSTKELQLQQQLKKQQAAMRELNQLIQKVIQQKIIQKQEQKKLKSSKIQSAKILSSIFASNKGKLFWPVARGFVSSKFGKHPHPVLKNVKIENLGIDIQVPKGSIVHAIFQGTVKAVAWVPGMQYVIIVQHGLYHTVYAKLQKTLVKTGQALNSNEAIGMVYTSTEGVTILQFQIWNNTKKLNPLHWLQKNK